MKKHTCLNTEDILAKKYAIGIENINCIFHKLSAYTIKSITERYKHLSTKEGWIMKTMKLLNKLLELKWQNIPEEPSLCSLLFQANSCTMKENGMVPVKKFSLLNCHYIKFQI